VAINPGHGSAAVSDFTGNTEGNIEGKVAVVLTAAPLRHRYGRLFCIAVGLPTNLLSSYGQYGLSPYQPWTILWTESILTLDYSIN